MKKILSIILSITMLFSMTVIVFADGVDGPMQKAKIKVATSADFKPFEYYDENGELTGFDIDLVKYIGEKIGFDIEFVNMSFDKLIPAVVNGKVDCAISGITVTEERDFVIDYSVPYLVSQSEIDGTMQFEEYAIVFPSHSKEKAVLKEAAGDPYVSIYTLVNDAIKEFIDNGTVDKLIRQYGLNKTTAETGYSYFIGSVSNGHYPGVGPVTVGGVVDTPIDEEIPDYVTSGSPLAPPSDWAKADVDNAKALNITTDDVIYRYRMSITREEFCELIYNFYNNLAKEKIVVNERSPFTDTNNEHIAFLNAMDIIYGKSATEFAPDDYLTREEAATIIFRIYLDFKPETKLNKRPAVGVFLDDDDISDWAYTGVYIMASEGIEVMVGDGNNLNYHPKRTLTTQEAIIALVRLYDRTINPETGNIIIKNAEDFSYGQIKELQSIVDNGHYPWRLDYEEVLKNFLNDKGVNVENGRITELAGGGSAGGISLTYTIGEKEYTQIYSIELFQPIDKTESGIWIVRTFEDITEDIIKKERDKELLLISKDNIQFKLNADISTINKEPTSEKEGRGDGFHWKDYSYEDVSVRALIGDDNSTQITHISTTSNNYKTPRDIKVGDSLKKLQEKYPEDLTKVLSDEVCYVYVPQGIGVNRIYFYLEKDIITKIEIENGIDG